jgi:AAA ATPase containing von Willebrand factor type A (vWA) domain
MAKCKLCKKKIPDGSEYCKDCLDKEKSKSNESYLDSLLNSVKNKAPNTGSIYKKRGKVGAYDSEVAGDKTAEQNFIEDIFAYDSNDLKNFDQLNFEDDLAGFDDEIIIEDEDLFGEALSKTFLDKDKEQNQAIEDMEENDQVETAEFPEEKDDSKEAASSEAASVSIDSIGGSDNALEYADQLNEDSNQNVMMEQPMDLSRKPFLDENDLDVSDSKDDFIDNKEEKEIEIEKNDEQGNEENVEESSALFEDEDYDTDLNNLLDKLDLMQEGNQNVQDNMEVSDQADTEIKSENINPSEEMDDNKSTENKDDGEEDDILSLLNQISADDPVADDVKAINDLMQGNAVSGNPSNMPSDVGEVFADALKAVSSLNDPNINEAELLSKIPGKNAKAKKEKKKKRKGKKSSENGTGEESGNKKPRKGLLKLLFGNVEDRKNKKKNSALQDLDESESTSEAPKKGFGKKNKKEKKGEEDSNKPGKKGKKKTEKKPSADKKSKKKEKKNTKEIIQVIDEIDEDETRINRLGASIVFIFFGLLAILLIVGTNTVSYTLSIQHATSYFDKKKYTQAYYEVYGMEIKDEDIEIYEKIKTVMFVNKQLNSYNNYTALNEYPQALDSLLKGLKRYDKYIELATMLGIQTDMDYVREQILAELKREFKLSEKEALKMTKIANMKDYSMKVYDIAAENKK